MGIVKIIIVIVLGYLIGSINFSILLGASKGVDIRKTGSGNAGATNTLRTFGKLAGLAVLAGDVLKGILACVIGEMIIGSQSTGLLLAGLGTVAGHNWPVFFGFKGGKGVAASIGVLFMMDYRIALIVLGIFIIVVLILRYVSLGSIIAAASFAVLSCIPVFGHTYWLFIAVSFVIPVIIILRHRMNIVRLIKGTESKIGAKKDKMEGMQ